LFPSSFEDFPLGKIPKGWKVTSLDHIANFLNGLALQKFPPEGDGSLPAIKIAQLRRGSPDGADRVSKNIPIDYIVHDGDVLFSWSGSLETVVWCGGTGALNQHLFKVTSSKYPKWFFYNWTLEHLPDFQHIAEGKATTMGHIQRHHLSDAKVVVPPDPVIIAADQIMSPIFQRQIHNKLESRTLSSIRDALLPKLISGEIRIKDAEKIVGEKV
ncbi:MAG: restriction endonuclease subunit S, partial [Nitrospirae bacterium 13_2_20CM_2_61_4]